MWWLVSGGSSQSQQDPGCCKGLDQGAESKGMKLGSLSTQYHCRGDAAALRRRRGGLEAQGNTLGSRSRTTIPGKPSPSYPLQATRKGHTVPSPHRFRGTAVKGAKKEQETAAAEPWEPFYCTGGRAGIPSGQSNRHRAQPKPASSSVGRGDRALGAGESPATSHPCRASPSPTGGAQSQDAQGSSRDRGQGDSTQLSRALWLPRHAAAFTQPPGSLLKELTEPTAYFDPSGKQRKGRGGEELAEVGRQRHTGEPGQDSCASAPGTTLPPGASPVLPLPLPNEGPSLRGASVRSRWAALPHVTSVPARAPPALPSPAGTGRDPCG